MSRCRIGSTLSLADALVEDLDEMAQAVQCFLKNELPVKGPEAIDGAMRYYLEQQYENDLPMQEAAKANDSLRTKFSLV